MSYWLNCQRQGDSIKSEEDFDYFAGFIDFRDSWMVFVERKRVFESIGVRKGQNGIAFREV